jgi:hypothetical protein
MGVTTVESLLGIMSVRHEMQVAGITRPPSVVRDTTKMLVEKLAELSPTETIDIVITEEPHHVQWVRVKTGEDLAEMPLATRRQETAEREFKRHLEGRRCTLFQTQQHWYNGCLENPYNVVFLQVDGDTYLRFFFDSGVFFWRSEVPALPPDFDGNSYRLVEPRELQIFVGHDVTSAHFEGIDGEAWRELSIRFASGTEFRLTNHDDTSAVSVVSAVAP